MPLPPGTRLGPYELTGPIGAGGMGEVYCARDTRLDREVAVKVLAAGLDGSSVARQRFQREARTVAALQHPNICTLHDVGETSDGRAYLVMELLTGETLQRRLGAGPLPIDALIEVSLAVADALQAAHDAGIVHRDIKPANILLTPRGPKVLDFGIAKARVVAGELEPTVAVTVLTEAGSITGTPAYMSPEQLRGLDVDARSDLFSFGLVLYEMATGRPAFSGSTAAAIGAAILRDRPLAPRTLRPDLPAALESTVLKALEKDPELRYQHASEMRSDLLRLKQRPAVPMANDRDTGDVAGPGETTEHAPRGRRWMLGAALGGVAAAVIALALLLSSSRTSRAAALTDKDTIVLADFKNTTGDTMFDDALRQGLSVQLQQSPFLSQLSDARARRALVLMGQSAEAKMTSALAQEVCVRTGSTALLEGSIAPLGVEYVIGLRATNCGTGELLAEQQVQVARKEQVIEGLSGVASTLRTQLGESLASVTQFSKPMEDATTASLEALKVFSDATRLSLTGGSAMSLPLFRRAVEIDPQFALAHAQLSLQYGARGESSASRQHATRAYELSSRTTERERLFITALYHRQVTGNLEKSRETLELWVRTYPRDLQANGLLSGFATNGTGRYQQSIDAAKRTAELDPDINYAYANQAGAYVYLNRFDEAVAVLQQAEARGIASREVNDYQYLLGFVKNDEAAMASAVARGKDRPAIEQVIAHFESLRLARGGQLRAALERALHAVDMAERAGAEESLADYLSSIAVWEGLFGNVAEARRYAMRTRQQSKGRDVTYAAAFALATAGVATDLPALADDLAARFPEDTSARFTYVPVLRAKAALLRGDAAAAIEELQVSAASELWIPALAFRMNFGALHAAYVRGEALLAQHKGLEAAAEFQKLIDQRGLVLIDPIGAIAHLQIGRAFAMANEKGRARAAYDEFFAIMKGADTDVPVLARAKSEYAVLR